MTALLDRLRGLKKRTTQRRAERTKTQAERAERRSVVGDRQRQMQNATTAAAPALPA